MRQIALHPAGCQLWNSGCAAAGNEYFAYASTVAVYVYRLDTFLVEKVLAGFDKTITGICWSPHDAHLLATTSGDRDIKVRSPSLSYAFLLLRAPSCLTLA